MLFLRIIWNLIIFLFIAGLFSIEPFNFDKFWDIVLKTFFILMFIVVIILEVKDWKSRNKEK